ncbi:hypothetical protein LTS18_005316 [Coniosporium uncinatum]|uniref:Uncharacterized protein n=1 Tax=Coniosporium uncinatum TaxID=93489 RepID=A0ACC3DY83_9PEZI|nr:hypothetical protein LTS18_005316 [Coniosporium uncinatum]
MQFFAIIAALAAVATAQFNGTAPAATGAASGTGVLPTSSPSVVPFPGAASNVKVGSALGVVVAGAVALVRSSHTLFPSEHLAGIHS